jgi:hypothetical protein
MLSLAGLLTENNKLEESEGLYREALAMIKEASGDERLAVAQILESLALTLGLQKKFTEAGRGIRNIPCRQQ